MSTTYRYTTTLSTLTCGSCDIPFAIPANMHDRVRASGDRFWCPDGHGISYHETDNDRLRKQAKAAEARALHLADQLQASVRVAEQTRVALLRDRQRFAAGVCPCCNRSFENVRRHMESKHPDFDATKVAGKGPRRFRCSCGMSFDTFQGLRVHQGRRRRDGWDEPGASKYRAHLTAVPA